MCKGLPNNSTIKTLVFTNEILSHIVFTYKLKTTLGRWLSLGIRVLQQSFFKCLFKTGRQNMQHFLLIAKFHHVCFSVENLSSDSAQHGLLLSGWSRSIFLIKIATCWLVGTEGAWWHFFLSDSPLINSAHTKRTCWNQDVTPHLRGKSLVRSLIGCWILYILFLISW